MIDNYALWQQHDREMSVYEDKQERIREIIHMAVDGIEEALTRLEDDFEEGCEMLRDLISRLEDER